MSDFKFSDSSSEYVEQPDLAQHSDFHFKDKDIEEQVQAEKQRRQAELEAEMARPPCPRRNRKTTSPLLTHRFQCRAKPNRDRQK